MSIGNKISKLVKSVTVGTGIFLLSQNVLADDLKLNIYYSGLQGSYHLDREAEYNEKNNIYGIGIEYNEKWDFFLKHADKNSYSITSNWLGFNYKAFEKKSFLDFSLGISAGMITGYEILVEGGGPFPIASLYIGINKKINKNFGFGIDINIPGEEAIWTWKTQVCF
ncbi:MAG: hypothetical protein OQK82_09110 [Candidatus Pacearchaeota archaeon]|nr:hypothetical protein [Candidatus Pacearchaeota archaeon]